MKKLGMLVVGAICVSFLSGCGNSGKKLTCTYNLSDDGSRRLEYVLNFDSKGGKIKSYTQSAVVVYDDETTDEEFNTEYEEAAEVCDNYKDMKGVSCNTSKNKKEIKVDLKVTMSELDDSSKEALATTEIEELSYDDFKTYMESASYTCE